jgi:hypothetical protein
MKFKLKERRFDSIIEIQTVEKRDKDAEAKWLLEVLLIMEIPLESLYQCQRGLFRRVWRRTEISVSVKVSAEEVREIWIAPPTLKRVVRCGVNSHSSRQRPVVAQCAQRNGRSGKIPDLIEELLVSKEGLCTVEPLYSIISSSTTFRDRRISNSCTSLPY